jgi:hypothetical protein
MCDTKKNSNKLRLRIINRNLLLQLFVALVFFLQYVVGCECFYILYFFHHKRRLLITKKNVWQYEESSLKLDKEKFNLFIDRFLPISN